jgi:hypothetical protein
MPWILWKAPPISNPASGNYRPRGANSGGGKVVIEITRPVVPRPRLRARPGGVAFFACFEFGIAAPPERAVDENLKM